MAHQLARQPIDSLDPHHVGHHEHVIVRAVTLVAVLAVLLFFTLLTVGQAQLEVFFSSTFDIHFPPMFNVAMVMGIAVIKATIVALYFMQLRYDNPINALVFLFCLMGVGLFLSLTMIDLGNRNIVTPIKAGEIQAGGLGIIVEGKVDTGTTPIVVWARQQRIDYIGRLAQEGRIDLGLLTPEEYFQQEKALFSHAPHAPHEPALSTANVSIPPQPVGPALFVDEVHTTEDAHGHH